LSSGPVVAPSRPSTSAALNRGQRPPPTGPSGRQGGSRSRPAPASPPASRSTCRQGRPALLPVDPDQQGIEGSAARLGLRTRLPRRRERLGEVPRPGQCRAPAKHLAVDAAASSHTASSSPEPPGPRPHLWCVTPLIVARAANKLRRARPATFFPGSRAASVSRFKTKVIVFFKLYFL